MCIIIGADIVPTKSNLAFFEQGDLLNLVDNDLAKVLMEASFRIFNMEVPLSEKYAPIGKYGPNLVAPVACINGYKALGTDLVTLANNHIMDQGEDGLSYTIKTLENANISFLGAGSDLYTAQKPFIFTLNKKKYGIYACAEHEFSIAADRRPGANPFDPLESLDHIVTIKAECDYVIVLYHGGKEHYRYPSPHLQKICRKIIQKGADLVICQHSHCIGCKEDYMNGTIIYGQGNFLFDAQNNEYWDSGLLVTINDLGDIDYIPIKKDGNAVKMAKGRQADKIIGEFIKRSEEIKAPGFIEARYKMFADQQISNYLLLLSGLEKNLMFRIINKMSNYKLQKIYADYYKLKRGYILRNCIECEAHRELILKGLEFVSNK